LLSGERAKRLYRLRGLNSHNMAGYTHIEKFEKHTA
jgi:hypothetical protein